MTIRNATYHDAPGIKSLLEQLGYNPRLSLLIDQVDRLFGKEEHQVWVYELNKEVLGVVTVHFLPQLAADGGLAIISCLAAVDTADKKAVAKALELNATEQARKQRCERIQVHCQDWRAWDQNFYKQQGYTEYPKYYIKSI